MRFLAVTHMGTIRSHPPTPTCMCPGAGTVPVLQCLPNSPLLTRKCPGAGKAGLHPPPPHTSQHQLLTCTCPGCRHSRYHPPPPPHTSQHHPAPAADLHVPGVQAKKISEVRAEAHAELGMVPPPSMSMPVALPTLQAQLANQALPELDLFPAFKGSGASCRCSVAIVAMWPRDCGRCSA